MLHLRPAMKRWPRTLAWSLALIAATGAAGALFAKPPALSASAAPDLPVTFNRDIAPIIAEKTARGGAAVTLVRFVSP